MKNKKGKTFITIGLLFILAALILTGYNVIVSIIAQNTSEETANYLNSMISEGNIMQKYEIDPDKEMPTKNVDGIDYIGVLSIPDLGLNLPIIDKWNYDYLIKAPCRYTGTAYKDNFVIAAHNYNSHFGRLKTLQEGSEIKFTDVDGNVFLYEVAVMEILEATNVEDMTDGEYDLTLFTCTIGGRARVTIRCERIVK